MSGVFSDPDGDALSFTAATSDADVATVSMAGGLATVTGVGKGVATISVTATDPGGASAQQNFQVTVPNRAPDATGTIPAVELSVDETETVDVSQYFTDPDGDDLSYSAASSDTARATVAVSGNALTVTAIAAGTATITVTATDPDAASAEQSFDVTVPNRAPEPTDTISDQELAVGDSIVIELNDYFTDPDGNALAYSAVTSNAGVATVSVAASVATVTGVGKGTATISVTATDPGGASAQQSLRVTVPNRAPEANGTIAAVELAVNETETVDVSQYFTDPDGDHLSYSAASSDTTLATVAVSGNALTVTAISAGTATITVTATDPDATSAEQSFQVTVPNRAPELADTIPDQDLAVGDSTVIELGVYFRDPDGDALTYTPETSDETVAAVSVSGTTLTVRAVAKGASTIKVMATDGGGLTVADSFDVTVPNQAPVVTGTIPDQRLTVAETNEWTGSEYFADPDGDALTYAAGTTDASIVLAIVSGSDFGILAVSPGTATVTVTATDEDGLSASQGFQVTVEAQGAVTITQVEPTVLIEGAPATIHGSGFSSIPGNNTVLIDGFRATVTTAAPTSLSVTVPYADCRGPRKAELRVTVGSLTDARTVGVTPLSREDLELPQGYYKVTPAGDGCLHLPGDASGGDYMIGVVSSSEDPASLTSVTMTSTLGDPTVLAGAAPATVVATRPQPTMMAAGLSSTGFQPVLPGSTAAAGTFPIEQSAGSQRDWEQHNRIMAANEELLRRLGPLPPALARARQAAVPAVNDTLTLFADFERTCAASGQVRAVVRFVGDNAVWLDDLENPSGTFTDSEFAGLDAFYASHTKAVHDAYLGPLSDVDGNSRVLILMTKEVNRGDGDSSFLGGWVWTGDLYPSSQCLTSNGAEIFFGRVPDPEGVFGHAWSRQQTLDYYPSLLTHEIAHIVQVGASAFGGADLTTWELEGGATLSEQLVAYRLFGHGSGQDLGYTAFESGRDWYGGWADGMARFFGWDSSSGTGSGRVQHAPEQCSWVGRPEEGNDGPCRGSFRAVYDVPSMVLRYAMDRWGGDYPGGEQALIRHLTRSPKRGFAALTQIRQWSAEQILADFYLTLWLELYVGDTYGMKSWNLYDIWRKFPAERWLLPYTWTSAAFQGQWSIRAGSSFYLRWTPGGSRGPTSLKVTSPDGASAPAHVSVWALRIR